MKLNTIGSLFSDAWGIYKKKFSVLMQIAVIPAAIIAVGDLLITEGGGRGMLVGGLFNFIGGLTSFLAALALISAIGKNTDFGKSFSAAFKLFWPAIWIALIELVAIAGGLTLLIVPGIFLAIAFSFANYLLVLENKHGMAALIESKAYVKGYWWAIVGRLILLTLVFAIPVFFIRLPLALLFGNIVSGMIYGVLIFFLVPFSVAYSYTIYENIHHLKPGTAGEAAKTNSAFVKVCILIGIVAIVLFVLVIGVAARSILKDYHDMPQGATMNGTAIISPASGAVGSMVTITFPTPTLGSVNTVLMNNLVAAKNIASPNGEMLTFTVPANLAPNCDPNGMCPQFLLHISSGDYLISLIAGTSTMPIPAGTFTVTGSLGGVGVSSSGVAPQY